MASRDSDDDAGNCTGSVPDSLQSFKNELTARGAINGPPDLQREDMRHGISDSNTLHRFLAARKYCVADAVAHFEKASQFRSANRLSELYDEADVVAFEETRSLYPHWSGRLCNKGQPIYVLDTSSLSSERMAAFKKSSAQLRISGSAVGPEARATAEMIRAMLWFEHLTRFVIPLCSAMSGTIDEAIPTPKMLLLVDVSGMTLRQIWNLKGYVQDFSQFLSASFPEILDQVFLINAPGSFPYLWNMIKGWIDPGTASKIVILQPDQAEKTLRSRVSADDLPRKYGGNLHFEHGMPTVLDKRLMSVLVWDPASDGGLPDGPLKWTRGTEGQIMAVATGSINGQRRMEYFATLRR